MTPASRIPRALPVLALAAAAASASASPSFVGVSQANPKVVGQVAPTLLTPELVQVPRAQGCTPYENPSALAAFYGYSGDGPMMPAPGDVGTTSHHVESTKTEPDKNTYLVLDGQVGNGPGSAFDYGRHFIFQGHELGAPDPSGHTQGAFTRINLDADAAHRVTLMATTDVNGLAIPSIDGSTWDPFSQHVLLTSEQGANGGVWAATINFPSQVTDVSGTFGRGGYEGIQVDSDGNIWIVEDVGGPAGTVNNKAKQPNSFIYRFVRQTPGSLSQGRLQALQVMSLAHPGQPISFHAGMADADILSDDVRDLHTYGKVFTTRWITIHDTAIDGTTPFSANALAKAAGCTPFKRPENGQFRPLSHFGEFLFDETGDTNLLSQAGQPYGGFGSILRLRQAGPSAAGGTLQLFYSCDAAHAGFDNVGFLSQNQVVFVEDAGDTLHAQRNALDSAWLFDVTLSYSNPAVNQPLRLMAQGRDPSATIDSGLLGSTGFQNEGDNEITGFHVSNGDPGPSGLLGASAPQPWSSGWRVFYTQQHGDNVTWEIVPDGCGGDQGGNQDQNQNQNQQ